MPFHYKALILVMFLTSLSFMIAKPVFVRFMAVADFDLRRNTWLTLTVVAFLVPDFWLFLLLFAVIAGYAASRDSNPVAMYFFLLLVLPPISKYAPIPGLIQTLALMDHLRVLALVILLPLAFRLLNNRASAARFDAAKGAKPRFRFGDILLFFYVGLQLVLIIPFAPAQAVLRWLVETTFFTLVPFYVISRYCDSRERIVECMAAFALALAVLVPLAIFETARGWILYEGLQLRWEGSTPIEYLRRGSLLRAQTTGGHSLVFGFSLAVAFGLWLYLQTRISSRGYRWLGMTAFVVGLLASLARGPWVGAAVILSTFSLIGPNATRRFAGWAAVIVLTVGVVSLTPYASDIVDYLPFVGSVGDGTVDYRKQVAEVSWQIVKMNPFFGSFNNGQYLEGLRQGQGIVDIVNSYASIAMTYGMVGVFAFAGFYLALAFGCLRIIRRSNDDPDLAMLGASLVACTIGILVMIATVSLYLSIPNTQLALAALMSGYIALAKVREPAMSGPIGSRTSFV